MSHSLTPNQFFVLEMMAHGFTNKEISFIKEVSVRTIEDTRKKIITTLGVKNIAEAIASVMSRNNLDYQPSKFMELKLILRAKFNDSEK